MSFNFSILNKAYLSRSLSKIKIFLFWHDATLNEAQRCTLFMISCFPDFLNISKIKLMLDQIVYIAKRIIPNNNKGNGIIN